MVIEKLHIISFCGVYNKILELKSGINIISGDNETGKSTIGDFIFFMLYGIVSDADAERYVSLDNSVPEGTMYFRCNNSKNENSGDYRIERRLNNGKISDLKVFDNNTNSELQINTTPGEYFLGMDAYVYRSTVYISQSGGGYVDGKRLSEAIENIMFSANENINTQKAIDKLDSFRAKLCHKNGKGGLINSLIQERDELKDELERNHSIYENIDTAEQRLSVCEEKLSIITENCENAKKRFTYYTTAIKLIQKENAVEVENCIESLITQESELKKSETVNGFFPSHDYFSELKDLNYLREQEKDKICRLNDEYNAEKNGHGGTEALKKRIDAINSLGGPDKALKDYRMSEKIMRSTIFFSVLFFILTLSSIVLYIAESDTNKRFIFTISFMAFVSAAIILLMYRKKTAEKLEQIVELTGAVDKDYVITILECYNEDIIAYNRYEKKSNDIIEQINSHTERYESLTDDYNRLLGYWNSDGYESAEKRFETIQNRILNIREKIENQKKILDTLSVEIDEESKEELESVLKQNEKYVMMKKTSNNREIPLYPACKDIKQFSAAAASEKKEYHFNQSAKMSMIEKKHLVEVELASLNSLAKPSGEIYENFYSVNQNISSLEEQFSSIALAIEKLKESSENLHNSIAPTLTKRASAFMRNATNGKFSDLYVNGEMGLNFDSGSISERSSRTLDLLYMSGGTKEIAYICLRFALVDFVFRGTSEYPVMIFDESFAQLDDKRLSNIFRILYSDCNRMQSIIFTSQNRDVELMKTIGHFNGIVL